MSFTGNVAISITGTMVNALDLETASAALTKRISQAFANGTGVAQATQHFSDTRTLAGTSEDIDLAGSLTNAFGATVTFATLRAILIVNNSTTAGQDLTVGGAASNGMANIFGDTASDKIKIRAGGCLLLLAPKDGYTVTAATGDKLKIDSGANTFTYDIVLIGT